MSTAPAPVPVRPEEPTWYTRWTLPLGRIFGIPVRWHVLFVLVIFLGLLSAYTLNSWQGYVFALVIYAVVLPITILVHELGHCIATRKLGAEVHSILLWPLGGLAFVGHTGNPRSDLLVALAGPLTHIPMVLLWFLTLLFSWRGIYHNWDVRLYRGVSPQENLWIAICAGAIILNIGLCVFNLLLPAYPLDGGRIFADLLLLCRLDAVLAAKITVAVSFCISILVLFYGLYRTLILTAAVGLFMLFPTFTLLGHIRRGTVHLHPMFCYHPATQPAHQPPPPPYPGNANYPQAYPQYPVPGYPAPGPAHGQPVQPGQPQQRTDLNAGLFAGHQSSAPV